MIRVAIADDHPVPEPVRPACQDLVEGERAGSIYRALGGSGSLLACRLMDILGLRKRHASVKVLVISAHPEDQWAMRSLQAGAAGYLTKDHSPEQLVLAIRRVARGGKYVSETMAERLAGMVDGATTRAPHEQLSDREFEVLRALGSGMMVKDVAAQLRLSAKTVSTYRTRLLEKMGLKSKADLVRYVVAHDLLK